MAHARQGGGRVGSSRTAAASAGGRLTRLNPTYVVQPMRHFTLDSLSLTAAEQERLLPVLTWFGWQVPVGLQLLAVAGITLGLISLAARVFRTSE
jgi:ABC-2 type transport system permease protein